MANLQAQEVLDKLEEDSDWNETDEEGSSGSEDEEPMEVDYLTQAQVIIVVFSKKERRISVSCSVLAFLLPIYQ